MSQGTGSKTAGKNEPLLEEIGMPANSLAGIQQEIQELRLLFQKRLSYDAAKDKAFDTLYDKMRQFDGDFQGSLKRGMLRSLLLLHDNMAATEELLSGVPEAQQHVSHLRQELLDILYVEDVEPIDASDKAYDRQRQEAIGTVPTDEPAKDGTIARTSKMGFMLADKVFRPQKVVIYRYSSPDTERTL